MDSTPNLSTADTNAVSSPPPSSSKVNLTLLIDKKNKRVLYAETGKDFVDFLFGLFELPLGFVLGLLIERGLVRKGSVGRIYQNVKDFDHIFLQRALIKNSLFKPNYNINNPLLKEFVSTVLQPPKQEFPSTEVQSPSYSSLHPTSFQQVLFPLINTQYRGNQIFQRCASGAAQYLSSSTANANPLPQIDGYVKGVPVRYMVMDDLTVKPISSISSIRLLKSFQVRDVDSLEEKIVEVNMETGLKLVEASIESTTVLTDVFFTNVAEAEAEAEAVSKEKITISKKRKENGREAS